MVFWTAVARADIPEREQTEEDFDHPQYLVILGEGGLELAIPAAYYWSSTTHQQIDWTLHWDQESWKEKLITFDRVRFDTNPWYVNTVRHPLAGVIDYDIARANGVGMFGSTAFAFVTGALWEYVVEYREDPSVNDMLFNTWGGIAIGEPMYQLAQLWRSSTPTLSDRAHVLVLSPADAVNDVARRYRRRHREVPHETLIYTGVRTRWFGDAARSTLAIGAEGEIDPPPGRPVKPGAYSSLRAGAWVGGNGSEHLLETRLQSRTSIAGSEVSDANGTRFVGLGTGFLYRHDHLAEEWDRIAVAHLLGGQLSATTTLGPVQARWDAALYGDFGLIQAHVFGPRPPFPEPPPFRSALQADGYYDAFGGSALGRMRLRYGPLRLDGEASLHRWWQVAGADRAPASERVEASTTRGDIPITPTGSSDWRSFWRLEIDYQLSDWAFGVEGAGAYRRGEWRDLERTTSDRSLMAVLTFGL